tara:strand:+ start:1403 stop:1915 length:513 start_codon:yes stop_codon:yes gene_type:complete
MKNNILITKNKSKYSADFRFNELKGTCLVGFSGIGQKKKEGDGFTPIGEYKLLNVYYRKDRIENIRSVKCCKIITELSGWCTDPKDKLYNKFVSLPFENTHEKLYRSDNNYDLMVTTSFNSFPAKPYKGSAIFVHCIGASQYTQGCIAFPRVILLKIIESLTEDSKIIIG